MSVVVSPREIDGVGKPRIFVTASRWRYRPNIPVSAPPASRHVATPKRPAHCGRSGLLWKLVASVRLDYRVSKREQSPAYLIRARQFHRDRDGLVAQEDYLGADVASGPGVRRRQRVAFHLHLVCVGFFRGPCVLVVAHQHTIAVIDQRVDLPADKERGLIVRDAHEKRDLALRRELRPIRRYVPVKVAYDRGLLVSAEFGRGGELFNERGDFAFQP